MQELNAAVHRLMDGGRYVTGMLAEKLAAYIGVTAGTATPDSPREIGGRQFDVLLRLGQGDTVKVIAADMQLSVKTVGTCRSRLLERLELKSNTEFVRYCLMHGLVR
jgi:DNA-binding NarL/FixJ family response regulator